MTEQKPEKTDQKADVHALNNFEYCKGKRGIYTPNQLHHPKGEELTGRGLVNPYGILDAVSLLLRYSCMQPDLSARVDAAVEKAVQARLFTGEAVPEGGTVLSTDELGDAVAEFVKQ